MVAYEGHPKVELIPEPGLAQTQLLGPISRRRKESRLMRAQDRKPLAPNSYVFVLPAVGGKVDVPVYQPYHADTSLPEMIYLAEECAVLRGDQVV